MVRGALKNSRAQVAVSVTGIAGPTGGTARKPIGLVYIGWGMQDNIKVQEHHFKGNRDEVRRQAVEKALEHLITFVIA
jgi:nicotinamide-nucleotide amidase